MAGNSRQRRRNRNTTPNTELESQNSISMLSDDKGNQPFIHVKKRNWIYRNFPMVLTFLVSIFGGVPGITSLYDRYTNNVSIRVNPFYYGTVSAVRNDSLINIRFGKGIKAIALPVFYFMGVLTNTGRNSLLPYRFSCYLTNKNGDTCNLMAYPIDERMSDTLKKMYPDFPEAGNDLLNAKMISGPGEARGTFMFAIEKETYDSFLAKFGYSDGHFTCLDQTGQIYSDIIHFTHH